MKDKETERRVKRSTGCRWLEPPEFARDRKPE